MDSVGRVLEYIYNEKIRAKLPFKFKSIEVTLVSGGYINYIYRLKLDNE